ncbi:MAG: hypothetical protein KDD66_06440 [Bdellovibrionales bacterium]|nr:hypothetical protein [Bdellovibrionales bacterium]
MQSSDKISATRKLGTFGGVFVPNVLTILGVIMFLRAGWVVGTAGLQNALIILLIAKSITFLTTLSLSAIASNAKVGVGGAYFLVSRSLGLEVGGSIGLPLFLAQAVSVSFYIVGFSESLRYLLPHVNEPLVSSGVLVLFYLVARNGAGLVAKTQYFILAALAVSLISFFAGGQNFELTADCWEPLNQGSPGFWVIFAIFFPAVTGIMSGVSMSGDLQTPSKSIIRGTLAAVGFTFVIYAAELVWLAGSATRDSLINDALVMKQIALVPELIFLGLWGASLSSALASLAAAPRTLQALGRDGIVPRVFGKGSGETNEPHVALIFTVLIAESCILVGDLNYIAPIITMFFLATYATINIVAGLERLVNNPSYRPSIRVHWLVSIIGCGGCVWIMFLISPSSTVIAGLIVLSIYAYLTRKRFETAWGDIRSGVWFSVTRLGLLRFESSRKHVRNWRPVMLVLVGNPKARERMVEFASAFEAGIGFLFLAQIVTGRWEKLLNRQESSQDALQRYIKEQGISGVAKVVLADDFEHGVVTLLQVSGLGQFQPDTVLVGWNEDSLRQPGFSRTVRKILELKRNLIVFKEASEEADLVQGVDVWWYSKDNGSLMLTLADLLTNNIEWTNHRIRVLRIIKDETAVEEVKAGTRSLIESLRVPAEVEIIVADESPFETIARHSAVTEVSFIGMSVESMEQHGDALQSYRELVSNLQGNVFLTKSWHDLRY